MLNSFQASQNTTCYFLSKILLQMVLIERADALFFCFFGNLKSDSPSNTLKVTNSFEDDNKLLLFKAVKNTLPICLTSFIFCSLLNNELCKVSAKV